MFVAYSRVNVVSKLCSNITSGPAKERKKEKDDVHRGTILTKLRNDSDLRLWLIHFPHSGPVTTPLSLPSHLWHIYVGSRVYLVTKGDINCPILKPLNINSIISLKIQSRRKI
ncbi:hypothetical protein Bca4012_039158 [Brassica carinata]